jgi:hypothetical protein
MRRGQREVKNTRVLALIDMGRWGVAREKGKTLEYWRGPTWEDGAWPERSEKH